LTWSWGHAAGDIVLQGAADRLSKAVRAEDTVARMGGDEFTVIMTGFTTHEEVVTTVGRIFESLSAPLLVGGQEVSVSASVGVAIFPGDGEDADRLLRNADIAMYKAKERRGNAVEFFRPELTSELEERVTLSGALRKAVDRSQLYLEFLPEVEVATGRVRGVEALVRWRHPSRGSLLPGDFLPLAKRAGQLPEITDFVLKGAAQVARSWQAPPGLPLPPVSVNISPLDLKVARAFPARLREVLSVTGLSPERLEVEIAFPDGAMGDLAPVLREIRECGVGIVLDDFGQGVLSLDLLRSGLFDRIKLSRTLSPVSGLDPRGAAILRAVTGLGRDLGVPVSAKGAESREAVRFLRDLGCRIVSGYGYSRPLPEGEIGDLLRSGRSFPLSDEPDLRGE